MGTSLANFNPDPNAPAQLDFMIPKQRQLSMSGNWARRLLDNELDVGSMRPFLSNDLKRSYITQQAIAYTKEGVPSLVNKAILTNDTNATLTYDVWKLIDDTVVKAAKPRLKFAADLQSKGLVYRLPNGISNTVIQFQQQSDITGATVSMDGRRKSEADRPVFSTVNFPLPLIHKDFQFGIRELMASRNGRAPLDLNTVELATERVAEQVEQFCLGTTNPLFQGQATYTWNGTTIQGAMNWSNRITYTITQPTAVGWTPQDTINDVLAMKKASQTANHFGPWMLYCGLAWDPYMDDDYKPTYNATTLRQRLSAIDGIQGVSTVDYIPDNSLILVQMAQKVVRLVIGMDIVVVQWESEGGWEMNFKVICCMLPQFRTDFYGNTGLVHGS